jgi:hypothetical protein
LRLWARSIILKVQPLWLMDITLTLKVSKLQVFGSILIWWEHLFQNFKSATVRCILDTWAVVEVQFCSKVGNWARQDWALILLLYSLKMIYFVPKSFGWCSIDLSCRNFVCTIVCSCVLRKSYGHYIKLVKYSSLYWLVGICWRFLKIQKSYLKWSATNISFVVFLLRH